MNPLDQLPTHKISRTSHQVLTLRSRPFSFFLGVEWLKNHLEHPPSRCKKWEKHCRWFDIKGYDWEAIKLFREYGFPDEYLKDAGWFALIDCTNVGRARNKRKPAFPSWELRTLARPC